MSILDSILDSIGYGDGDPSEVIQSRTEEIAHSTATEAAIKYGDRATADFFRTRQAGTLRDGSYIALTGHEEIQLGAVYEFRGSFHWAVQAILPDSWLEAAAAGIMRISRPEFDVIGCELDSHGQFRIQLIARHNSPVLILVAAVAAAGILILAGMKIEQMWQVVTGGGPGGGGFGILDSVGILAIALVGYLIYQSVKSQ